MLCELFGLTRAEAAVAVALVGGATAEQVARQRGVSLMTVRVQSPAEQDAAAPAVEERAEHIANVTYTAPTETGEVETTVDPSTVAASVVPPGVHVGRNDPCPCGSGKTYQQCHGKLS